MGKDNCRRSPGAVTAAALLPIPAARRARPGAVTASALLPILAARRPGAVTAPRCCRPRPRMRRRPLPRTMVATACLLLLAGFG